MYKQGGDDSRGPGGVHSCTVCGRVFDTILALDNHMTEDHGELGDTSNSKLQDKFKKGVLEDAFAYSWGGKANRSPSTKPRISFESLFVNFRSSGDVGSQKQPQEYRCDLCNKVFKRYQVLGGHKRACLLRHQQTLIPGSIVIQDNSPPQVAASLPPSQAAANASALVQFASALAVAVANQVTDHFHPNKMPPDEADVGSQKQPKEHGCNLCNRVFKGGQALGGHIRACRCHHQQTPISGSIVSQDHSPPPQVAASLQPPSQAAARALTPSASALAQANHSIANFDLNEMPPDEEEDNVDDKDQP